MRFSLNLSEILNEMGNEYDETLADLGIDWREVAEMIIKGEITFGIESTEIGDYLFIDIPDKIIKKEGVK